ncbi:MAG: 3-hydroxyacyl-CoA dehydrogenase NAD-binding domain-containing protein [Dehalococcoidia bacterium]
MPVERAAVIGAGTMGAEIAQVIAEQGIPVKLKDVSQEFLERGMRHVEAILRRRVERGRLTDEEAAAQLARIEPTLGYEDLADVDFVIEAVPERLALKQAVFGDLNRACKPEAILATNTSSLSVGALAAASGRPSHVVGFHFFNPASVMKLIEVVVTPETSEETTGATIAFGRQIGKLPVRVEECPGFLVNRILFAGMAEGMRYQHENRASVASVDAAMRNKAGVPMGPFQLADLVGLDVTDEIGKILETAYGDRFSTPPTLGELVAQGKLGQKSGEGYYRKDGTTIELGSNEADGDLLVQQVMGACFLEALRCLDEGVATANDIDLAMQAGAGWPVGPIAWAEQIGLSRLSAMLGALAVKVGPRFTPPARFKALADSGGALR